jgi:hypothetical protein
MSAYSLKLNVGDVTIEATATTQVNVEKLFQYALDRLAEIKKNLTLMNKYNLTLIFSLLRLILMTMSITNANKLLLPLNSKRYHNWDQIITDCLLSWSLLHM